MTWPEAKNALVKGLGGVFIAWAGWSMQQSLQASTALREAVADLKAVVWELRASAQSTKEQVRELSQRMDRFEERHR